MAMTAFITIFDLVISLLVLGLGLFVLRQNPTRKINQIFSLTILSLAFWIISSSLSDISGFYGSELGALWWARAAIIGPFLFCTFFLYFTYYFPEKTGDVSSLKIFGIFLIPLVSISFFHTDYNVSSITLETWGTGFVPGVLYLSLLFCLVTYFSIGLYRLARIYFSSKSSHERAQVFYVFWGSFAVISIGTMTNLLLPGIWNMAQYSIIGPAIAMLIFTTLTAYAILRHHLLETWVVMRMGTIFAILFSIIAFIYVSITSLLSQYIGGTVSLLITSLFITLTFEPLKKFIADKTDRIFFSKHYNLDIVIKELTSAVHNLSLNLNKILLVFSEITKRDFKVEKVAVAILTPKETFLVNPTAGGLDNYFELNMDNPLVGFLSENQDFILNREEILDNLNATDFKIEAFRIDLIPGAYEELVRLDFVLAIPLSVGGKLIAIYFIGHKKSKDLFTRQDLDLLDHLTGEAGVLINNARLYEDLKRLDEAKSNFISVVSHQLRTPLSAMRWTTELLLDGSVDKKSEREFLKDTYKNSMFMIYHLDDMLTALDVEDKEIEVKKEKCSSRPIIDEILKDNDVLIKNKKLDISVDLAEGTESIFCDCKKIKKSLEVLITNAIHYTPDSGGEIRIIVRKKSDGQKSLLEVSISDNGMGISNEEQRYIFEKFFRGEEAKKISPNGFGLGLFIVRAFARAHGGDAHFESAGRNKGSKFNFTIIA